MSVRSNQVQSPTRRSRLLKKDKSSRICVTSVPRSAQDVSIAAIKVKVH
jgi:hypothetical protein